MRFVTTALYYYAYGAAAYCMLIKIQLTAYETFSTDNCVLHKDKDGECDCDCDCDRDCDCMSMRYE